MIKSLELTNFTCFDENKFEFSSGINVIIGKNGTGKTHILKVIAALVAANEEFGHTTSQSKERLESIIAERLVGYFRPEQLGRLTRRQQGRVSSKVSLDIDGQPLSFSFSGNSKTNVKLDQLPNLTQISSLYLPPREMFSLFEGFLGLNAKRELAFDETYVKLAEALDGPILRGARYDEIKKLISPLETALQAKAIKENGRFYLKEKNNLLEAHLVAEGLRKIASIMYLITNGSLKPTNNSILFWDEPESNLNPKLITVVCDLLMQLASANVQIFIATHDYLLTHQLSLYSEYKDKKTPPMKFFCLEKEEDKGAIVETGTTLAEIDNNPILNEYAAFYDLEQSFFDKSIQNAK